MKLSQGRQTIEHLVCRLWMITPIFARVGHLGQLLSSSETVVYRATFEPFLPKLGMDTAVIVRAQIGTGGAAGLVKSKVR